MCGALPENCVAFVMSSCFVHPQDPAWVIDPSNNAGGYAAAQIYFDAVNGHIGGTAGKWGGIALLMVPLGAMFFCGLSCVTGNSRWAALAGTARSSIESRASGAGVQTYPAVRLLINQKNSCWVWQMSHSHKHLFYDALGCSAWCV